MKGKYCPLLHDPKDVKIALEAATQMAERFGEDMVIQQDLSVTTLWAAEEPPLEIVRCPAALKKNKRTKIIRMVK